MKNVYDRSVEYMIDGANKKWQLTSIWRDAYLLSDEEVDRRSNFVKYNTFDELYNAVKNNEIKNAETRRTLFKERRVVCLNNVDGYGDTIYEKNFRPVSVRTTFERIDNMSLEGLFRNLKAEEFIEYCKERDFYFKI